MKKIALFGLLIVIAFGISYVTHTRKPLSMPVYDTEAFCTQQSSNESTSQNKGAYEQCLKEENRRKQQALTMWNASQSFCGKVNLDKKNACAPVKTAGIGSYAALADCLSEAQPSCN